MPDLYRPQDKLVEPAAKKKIPFKTTDCSPHPPTIEPRLLLILLFPSGGKNRIVGEQSLRSKLAVSATVECATRTVGRDGHLGSVGIEVVKVEPS